MPLVKILFCIELSLLCISCHFQHKQYGPDPWHYESSIRNGDTVPPDLKLNYRRNDIKGDSLGDFFFKRLLTIVLKNGQTKKNEDDSVDVSLFLKLPKERWELLSEFTKSNKPPSEDVYRRSVGYLEEAITQPTIADKIATAWSDHVQVYLILYKFEILWMFGICASICVFLFLWRYVSHKQCIFVIFIGAYLYQTFLTYKEAEQQEYQNFMSAISSCKWFFWTSSCEVPMPDPLLFLRHMHPVKIGIRLFSLLITEPMLMISTTIQTICHGMTDGIWYPFDKLFYFVLVVSFNVIMIFFLITIMFSYILNIPLKLNFLAGLVSVGVSNHSNRPLYGDSNTTKTQNDEIVDRLSGPNLEKLLSFVTNSMTVKPNMAGNATVTPRVLQASMGDGNRLPSGGPSARLPPFLQIKKKQKKTNTVGEIPTNKTLKRSVSAGRLDSKSQNDDFIHAIEPRSTFSKRPTKSHEKGGGDFYHRK